MGKNIFLLFYILLAFDRVSLATESDCRNSNGTNLIFVNGINWTEDTVRWMTYDVLNPALDLKKIEPRIDDVNNVDPELYDIGYSYNHARSLSWDLLESTVGFIANEGIVIEENYLYSVLYKYIFMSVFIINLDYPDSIISFLTSPDGFVKKFHEALKRSSLEFGRIYEGDINKLYIKVASSLANNKRTLLIAESQGAFFGNEIYRRLNQGYIPNGISPEQLTVFQNLNIEENKELLSYVYIANPIAPNNPKNKEVLHLTDVINFVSIPASEANEASVTFRELIPVYIPYLSDEYGEDVPLIGVIEGDGRPQLDRTVNHFFPSTYLNNTNVPFVPLQNLRQFTIDSIHEAAELLPLSCVYCVSDEFPDGQLGIETPDYGFVATAATVTGNVLLRDGVEICGESVIEVLDENLLIMDRSTLWDVKMSISGIVQYGESWIVDSKLSNLEIRDTSTIGKFGSRASIVDGGIIVNDGTDPNTDGRPAEVYQSTLTDVNVFNSQIWRSTLSNLSIEKSVIDSIFIDAGSGVNASTIYDSYVVNSHVANSTIERSSIVNSDIIENSMISDSGITGDTTRTLIRNSTVRNSGVTDSTLTNQTIVLYSSVNGSSLSGSHVSDCLVNGVNSSGYNCINGEIQPW